MANPKQLIERLACLFKDTSYFLSTSSPFSSVLLPLPHKLHLLQPFLKQLSKKADFDLNKELSQFRLAPTEKEVELHSDYLTKHSIYGIQFDKETEFLVRDGQEIKVKGEVGDGQLLGVFLFGKVAGRQIGYMSSSLWKLNEIMMKIFVLFCLFKLGIRLQNVTRQENFHKLEKKK